MYREPRRSWGRCAEGAMPRFIGSVRGPARGSARVWACIGPCNWGAAGISIPILCKANLAMISPANTGVGLTKPGKGEPDEPAKYYPDCKRNYTRVVPADDLQGSAAANWAKDLGVKSVYILDDQELYGHGLAT